ncbi:hypothetical protein [Clostridium cibarium]|uniref:Uncharacterized protein n=1 Tax=Clostridium cibarium TaxID=2762247 RepID=A0ABR8PVC5_9CLOT|nr:hypothetical protein [Clostridium cibarium]MBD7912082.1 hypothetical protein [Clostridium cibarium]
MINDEIKLRAEDAEVFDKKQIALAIRNANYEDEIACSLLEQNIIAGCDMCSLKKICEEIDKVSLEFKKSTTKVVKSFEFN